MSVEGALVDDLPGIGETPGRVDVTTHATLAWLKRVNPMDLCPAASIRQAWQDSEPTASHPDARRYQDVYLIYETRDEEATILTVYPVERQLGEEGEDS